MAVSPLDGSVYVSDPEAHQVLRIGVMGGDLLPVVVVGSGQRCLPGDKNRCGDGGQAIHARLTYPKGEHWPGVRCVEGSYILFMRHENLESLAKKKAVQ